MSDNNENFLVKELKQQLFAMNEKCNKIKKESFFLKRQLSDKDDTIKGLLEYQNILKYSCSYEMFESSQIEIEKPKQRLQDSIIPKFMIDQEVFVYDWSGQLRSGTIYEIQTNQTSSNKELLVTYMVSYHGGYESDEEESDYFEEKDVFATEEEAKMYLSKTHTPPYLASGFANDYKKVLKEIENEKRIKR